MHHYHGTPITPRAHLVRLGGDIERAVGQALGRALPWLLKVQRLPGAGMLWACWPGEHAEAANDGRF